MGHELAHADLWHSTQQVTKACGIQKLISLSFSREDESGADDCSVRDLCDTDWASDGAAGFFEMLGGWSFRSS